MPLSTMVAALKLDTSQFTPALQKASSDINAAMSQANKGLSGFNKLGSTLKNVGTSLSIGVTLPLVGFGAAAVKAAGDIEALTMGLDAITGSASETQRQLAELMEVAKLPGLGLEEAIRGSIRLQAVGIEAGLAKDVLTGFGNALASVGYGRAELDRVITQLTQMASSSKILTADLRPVIQTVPQLAKVLLNLYGTIDASEINEQLAEQGLTTKDFVRIVSDELNKLPGVGDSINNLFENFSDTVKVSLGKIGNAITPIVRVIVDSMIPAIEGLATWFTNLSPLMQSLVIGTAAVAAAIGPLALVAGHLLTVGLSLKAAIAGWGIAAGGAAPLMAAIVPILTAIAVAAAAVAVLKVGESFIGWRDAAKDLEEAEGGASDALLRLETHLRQNGVAVNDLRDAWKRGETQSKTWEGVLRDAAIKLGDQRREAGLTKTATDNLTNAERLQTDVAKAMKDATANLESKLKDATTAAKDHDEAIRKFDDTYWKWDQAMDAAILNLQQAKRDTDAFNRAWLDGTIAEEAEAVRVKVDAIERASKSVKDIAVPIFETDMPAAFEDTGAAAKDSAGTLKTEWNSAITSVSTALTNGVQSMVGILIGTEEGTVGDAFKKLGGAFLSIFSETVMGFVETQIKKIVTSLLSGDGLMGAIKSIGEAFKGIFSGGASAVGTATGAAGTAAGGAGSVGGAAGAASSGVMGALTMVGALGSMVTGIISNFQNAKQETTLNAIEENTRYSKAYLGGHDNNGGILNVSWLIKENTEYAYQSLDSIKTTLWEMLSPVKDLAWVWTPKIEGWVNSINAHLSEMKPSVSTLPGIFEEMRGMRADIRQVVEVNVRGFGENRDIGMEIARALRTQGALA